VPYANRSAGADHVTLPTREATLIVSFRDEDGARTRAFVGGVMAQWRVDPTTAAAAQERAARLVLRAGACAEHPVDLSLRLAPDGRSVEVRTRADAAAQRTEGAQRAGWTRRRRRTPGIDSSGSMSTVPAAASCIISSDGTGRQKR